MALFGFLKKKKPADKPNRATSKTVAIMQRDFATFFDTITKSCKVQSAYTPQNLFDPIIALKRQGDYSKASSEYAKLVIRQGILSPDIVKAWYKVLAPAGDFKDAFTLVDYLFQHMPKRDTLEALDIAGRNPEYAMSSSNAMASVFVHKAYLETLIEGGNPSELDEYLSKLSGNPNYSLRNIP